MNKSSVEQMDISSLCSKNIVDGELCLVAVL